MKHDIRARRKRAEQEVVLVLGLVLALIFGSFCLGYYQEPSARGVKVAKQKLAEDSKEVLLEKETKDGQIEEAALESPIIYDPNNEGVAHAEERVKSINVVGNGGGAEEGMVKVITDYYDTYYRALASLQSQDIKPLFSGSDLYTNNSAHFEQAYLNTLIDVRLAQQIDLSLYSYNIDLDLFQVDQLGEDTYTVTLIEDQDLVFAATPNTHSYRTGVLTSFRLVRENGEWRISRREKEADLFLLMNQNVVDSGVGAEDEQAYVNELKDKVVNDAKESIESFNRAQYISGQGKVSEDTGGYDREKATAYAAEYSLKRNPEFEAYDDYGGNCNNFISQCLLAGGIPQDEEGEYVWYSSGYDEPSGSFILVNNFYNYAVNNQEGGFDASVDDNFYSGQPGDIIQYGAFDEWMHSVIIADTIKDANGKTIDYLIDSNTANLKNYPASAYSYPEKRLIRILGVKQ